jgi:uncharacterized protein (DUF4415 family)
MKENDSGRPSVRYPGDQVPVGRTDWERLAAMTDEEIESGAMSDPDNPPLTPAQLASGALTMPGQRRKVPVCIRLDHDIVEYYRSAGPGYQTRINDDLRTILRNRQRQLRKRATGATRTRSPRRA